MKMNNNRQTTPNRMTLGNKRGSNQHLRKKKKKKGDKNSIEPDLSADGGSSFSSRTRSERELHQAKVDLHKAQATGEKATQSEAQRYVIFC